MATTTMPSINVTGTCKGNRTMTQHPDGPAIEFFKRGTVEMLPLDDGDHHSLYRDIAVVSKEGPLTAGIWQLTGQGDYHYEFGYDECIWVFDGHVVVRDADGVEYLGERGDLFIFRAPVSATFLAGSDALLLCGSNSRIWL